MANDNRPQNLNSALLRLGVHSNTSLMGMCNQYAQNHNVDAAIHYISVTIGGEIANNIFQVIENWPSSKDWFDKETGEYTM
ncbi:MAG: hypothetical protein P8P30_09005 [Rickettsiales bacterium]|nr:hypothetical protein [Rickettsiales bacterium]